MSYDPTNENEALDPAGAPQEPVASAAAPEPPPPPPAAPPGDPLFDEPGYAAGAAAPRASGTSGGVDKKTLIGAGVGAAVIALGAVVGINLASSGAENADTAAGPAGMNGQMGQMPGAGQDGGTGGQAQGQGQMGQMPGGQSGMQGGMQGGPSGSTGTVERIGDGTLTIATEDGESVEVTTTDDTEVSLSEAGSADDIDEGDTVVVLGQAGDDSSVTAERVIERSGDDGDDAGGGPGGMGPVSGEVRSVDGDRFVVTTDSGDLTVTMTDDTTVVIERSASVDDLSEGDEVFVHTHEADDGSAWAERIIAGDALPDGAMSGGMGQPPSGMQGGPSGQSGQSDTMTPPGQGGTDGSSGTTGGIPGANAGPSGVTTT